MGDGFRHPYTRRFRASRGAKLGRAESVALTVAPLSRPQKTKGKEVPPCPSGYLPSAMNLAPPERTAITNATPVMFARAALSAPLAIARNPTAKTTDEITGMFFIIPLELSFALPEYADNSRLRHTLPRWFALAPRFPHRHLLVLWSGVTASKHSPDWWSKNTEINSIQCPCTVHYTLGRITVKARECKDRPVQK